jgi:hypothetical protein
MNLDIRFPIGMLFGLVGALLAVYGVTSDATIYERSLGYNVNLVWGLVLLAFGVIMIVLGRRGTSGVRPAEQTPEGWATEIREHGAGLESERPPR